LRHSVYNRPLQECAIRDFVHTIFWQFGLALPAYSDFDFIVQFYCAIIMLPPIIDIIGIVSYRRFI